MNVLFTCGGTAGHINPAVALARMFQERNPDCQVLFVGAKGGMEEKLVPKEGFPLKTVTISNFWRSVSPSGIKHNLRTVRNLSVSKKEAEAILDDFRPDLVVGTGGYASYPVIKAVTNYRIAHELLTLGVPLIPRIITEMAHSETGIDIHPGATIGSHFTIDHGTGVVIGATCIIGNNVKLYQGVTLGAKSFPLDENGNPIKGVPRHPILADDVIVYSNATILGRITLAKGTVVGGNLWVTESTQPGEQLVQAKKRKSHVVRPEDWGGL